jgi:hypothetical protein
MNIGESLLFFLLLMLLGACGFMMAAGGVVMPVAPATSAPVMATPTPTPSMLPTPEGEGETFRSPTVIESVDALILESFPMQLQLRVTGYQPDGCDFPVQVEQSIVGTTITVNIFRSVPLAVICPAMILTYDETIAIEGTFTGGIYTIIVNDFTTQVDFGGAAPTPTPFGIQTGTNIVVESVTPAVQSAAPATVTVTVTGYYEDACDFPIIVSQTQSGRTITVTLSREIPPNVRCAAGPTPFSFEFALYRLLEGEYTLDVNGVITMINVP